MLNTTTAPAEFIRRFFPLAEGELADRLEEMTISELLEEFGTQVLRSESFYQDYSGAFEYDEASKFVTDFLCGRI